MNPVVNEIVEHVGGRSAPTLIAACERIDAREVRIHCIKLLDWWSRCTLMASRSPNLPISPQERDRFERFLDAVPALKAIVTINPGSCDFSPSLEGEERRAINEYVMASYHPPRFTTPKRQAAFEVAVLIRQCTPADLSPICEVINEAAVAYRGVIASDRWKEPYMPLTELQKEIRSGVLFWGAFEGDALIGVMGLQHVDDVSLIRHAYTRTSRQGQGIGKILLKYVASQTERPLLIGTWTAATWAIGFYQSQGFRLLGKEKNDVLRRYWTIPERQIEESVVLADGRWVAGSAA